MPQNNWNEKLDNVRTLIQQLESRIRALATQRVVLGSYQKYKEPFSTHDPALNAALTKRSLANKNAPFFSKEEQERHLQRSKHVMQELMSLKKETPSVDSTLDPKKHKPT